MFSFELNRVEQNIKIVHFSPSWYILINTLDQDRFHIEAYCCIISYQFFMTKITRSLSSVVRYPDQLSKYMSYCRKSVYMEIFLTEETITGTKHAKFITLWSRKIYINNRILQYYNFIIRSPVHFVVQSLINSFLDVQLYEQTKFLHVIFV